MGVERVGATEHWEVWFAHSRLAIVDLSVGGQQPMVRGDVGRRAALTFNGEIYNHRALRSCLASTFSFASSSDTEVLLAGLLTEGPGFLAKANAMMAAAFWNEAEKELLLVRDRLGKKPLYVYRASDLILFASELKAFHSLGVSLTEDDEAWAYYRWLRHVPGEKTIYRECTKLPAASFARLSLSGSELPALRSELFWDPLEACGQRFAGTLDDAADAVQELLDDATKIRLDADVPVGVFLSGGIDSNLVASSIARVHGARTTAFVVRAADPALDESAVALGTAKRLGLEAHVLDLPLTEYRRQTAGIPFHYDEPCAPLSQIPTMAIAEAARRHVKVVLTGDGGDEVFLGYPWFGYPERLFRYRWPLEVFPGARDLAARVLPSGLGKRALRQAVRVLGLNEENLELKQKLASALLRARKPVELYDFFQQLQPFSDLDASDRASLGTMGILDRAQRWYPGYSWHHAAARSVPELLAALELVTSMRDEILVKVDRATMAYGLEARSPLLDYRVVELGLSLPLDFKMSNGGFKRVLRHLCERTLGPEVARLKKSGFGVPPPNGLPPGPTDAVRWARAVENDWRAHWRKRSCQ
jgi:asparagine synthase (glutamine-hydrolysing)